MLIMYYHNNFNIDFYIAMIGLHTIGPHDTSTSRVLNVPYNRKVHIQISQTNGHSVKLCCNFSI